MGSRPLEETELIEHARDGDLSAYEELVRRYRAVALRAATIAGGGDEAEDAAQEAFVKAYRALGSFRRGAPFRPWLLRIVANEARNRARSSRRRTQLALRAAAMDAPSGDAAPSPEGAILAEDDRRALQDAMNALGERDRMAIGYRYFLDLSEGEMAQALGWPRGTVKSRLSRAMARLRETLEAQGGDR